MVAHLKDVRDVGGAGGGDDLSDGEEEVEPADEFGLCLAVKENESRSVERSLKASIGKGGDDHSANDGSRVDGHGEGEGSKAKNKERNKQRLLNSHVRVDEGADSHGEGEEVAHVLGEFGGIGLDNHRASDKITALCKTIEEHKEIDCQDGSQSLVVDICLFLFDFLHGCDYGKMIFF